MGSIEVRTEIAASPATVYSILMDFSKYSEWNPMVVQISGNPIVGNKIEAHVKLGERSPQTFKPIVLKNDEDKEFRWVGTLLASFLYRGEHYFKIEPTSTGCTFVHGELFSGVLEPLLSKMLKKDMEPSFRNLNEALRTRAEASS